MEKEKRKAPLRIGPADIGLDAVYKKILREGIIHSVEEALSAGMGQKNATTR